MEPVILANGSTSQYVVVCEVALVAACSASIAFWHITQLKLQRYCCTTYEARVVKQ